MAPMRAREEASRMAERLGGSDMAWEMAQELMEIRHELPKGFLRKAAVNGRKGTHAPRGRWDGSKRR